MAKRLISVFVVLCALICAAALPASADADATGYDVADRDNWYTAELNGHIYCCFDIRNAMADPRFGTTVNFWTAESFCEALGGHLAVITSAEENLVVAKLGEAIGASNIYIGLYYDWEDYEWKWVTGEPLEYTAWLDGDYGGPEYGDNNASYVRYHLPRFGNHQNYGTRWEKTLFHMTDGGNDNCAVFICEWNEGDDFLIPNLVLDTGNGEPTLLGTLSYLDEDALIVCAVYDEDGRMLFSDYVRINVDAKAQERRFQLTMPMEGACVKLFVLDAESLRPLCSGWDSRE